MSSVIPSLKYRCSTSPPRLANGSTAMEGRPGLSAPPSPVGAGRPAGGPARRIARMLRASASVSGSGAAPSCRASSSRQRSYCASAASARPCAAKVRISARCTPSCSGSSVSSRSPCSSASSGAPRSSAACISRPWMRHASSRKRSRSAASHCWKPGSATASPSISSPPRSAAAARSSSGVSAPASASASRASMVAAPARRPAASLPPMIAAPPSAPRSSESAWRRLPRAWASLRSPQSKPARVSRGTSTPSRSARYPNSARARREAIATGAPSRDSVIGPSSVRRRPSPPRRTPVSRFLHVAHDA